VVAIHYQTALKATQIINPQETNEPSIPKNKGTPIISKNNASCFHKDFAVSNLYFRKK